MLRTRGPLGARSYSNCQGTASVGCADAAISLSRNRESTQKPFSRVVQRTPTARDARRPHAERSFLRPPSRQPASAVRAARRLAARFAVLQAAGIGSGQARRTAGPGNRLPRRPPAPAGRHAPPGGLAIWPPGAVRRAAPEGRSSAQLFELPRNCERRLRRRRDFASRNRESSQKPLVKCSLKDR